MSASDSSTSLNRRKRRSRIEIIFSIINLVQNGESEYKIREGVSLNGNQIKSYLKELTKLGFIEIKFLNGRRIYVTSQAGSQFLKQYWLLKKALLKH